MSAFALGFLIALHVVTPALTQERVRMCYFTNWAQHRTDSFGFTPENIDPSLCTHILFAFAYIKPDGSTIVTTEANDEEMYAKIISLKQNNTNLKVLLSVGGANDDQTVLFEEVAKNNTQSFVNNVIAFLRQYGFDGLDVDWEFPDKETRGYFTNFIAALSNGFSNESATSGSVRLLLTIAAKGNHEEILTLYEPSTLAQYVDYIFLMAYNLWGSGWTRTLAHHTALYVRPQDAGKAELRRYTVNKTVSEWIKQGVSTDKLVLGLASYGQSAKLVTPTQHNVGDEHVIPNSPLKELLYYQVCENLALNGWTRFYEPVLEGAFAYSNRTLDWVCYDDSQSFRAKTEYALEMGLAGVFVWTMDFDDFSGRACNNGTWPLLRTIRSVLENQTVSPPLNGSNTTTTTTTKTPLPLTTMTIQTPKPTPPFVTRIPPTGATRTPSQECKKFECPRQNSPSNPYNLYPDPYNCRKYYQCGAPGTRGSRIFHMFCPANLHFDPSILRCNWPVLVNCTPC